MSTRSGHTFRGKLTDAERDELLLQMVEQLHTMNLRLGEVETRINQNEARSNATVNDQDGEASDVIM